MFKNIQLFSTLQAELSIVFGFRIARKLTIDVATQLYKDN